MKVNFYKKISYFCNYEDFYFYYTSHFLQRYYERYIMMNKIKIGRECDDNILKTFILRNQGMIKVQDENIQDNIELWRTKEGICIIEVDNNTRIYKTFISFDDITNKKPQNTEDFQKEFHEFISLERTKIMLRKYLKFK